MVAVLRRYRRKNVVEQALDERERDILRDSVALWRAMSPSRQERTLKLARVLVKEKHWEGCGGLELTDHMKLVIAVQAAAMLSGMEPAIDPLTDPVYPNVQTVLVYPSGFVATIPRMGAAGVMTEGEPHLGEAHYQGLASGPVIVSWSDALAGGQDGGDGRNLVIHEFAHKLDFMDGVIDGTPPMRSREQLDEWTRVMSAEHRELIRRARMGLPSLLSYYGATNPAEFFAVASEAYFERGDEMRALMPELHGVMHQFYG